MIKAEQNTASAVPPPAARPSPHAAPTVRATVSASAKRLRLWLCILAALIGLAQVTAHYSFMDPDGLSYIEIGEAYLKGDWHNAVNAYWSPLYSWLIAAVLLVVRPTPYREFTAVQFLNYLLFLCSLASFSFLLNEVMTYAKARAEADRRGLPDWAWIVFGYSLFLWASVEFIGVHWPTPDVLVTIIVYLAAALTLRMRTGGAGQRHAVALGAVLGLGYLSKLALLPVGCAFIAATIFSARPLGVGLRRAAASGLVLLLIMAPFVAAMSLGKGRLTLGESGKLNYSWNVNQSGMWVHWQGELPRSGVPLHPTRKVLRYPAIFEFGSPVGGTYPPWYDPTYWHEGLKIFLDLRQQSQVLLLNVRKYAEQLTSLDHGGFITPLFLLMIVLCGRSYSFRTLWGLWPVVLPTLFALFMYCMVFILPRYDAAFTSLIFLGVLCGARTPAHALKRRILLALMIAASAALIVSIGRRPAREAYAVVTSRAPREGENSYRLIADELKRRGVRPGDRVGSIGYSFFCFWARLTRTKVVVEMPSVEPFWLTPSVNEQVLNAFSAAGAKVIVARQLIDGPPPPGWERVENTDAFIYLLPAGPAQ